MTSHGHGEGRTQPRPLSRHPSEVCACPHGAAPEGGVICSSVQRLRMATHDYTGHPLLLSALCPHSTLADCATENAGSGGRRPSPTPILPSEHTLISEPTQVRPGPGEALPSKTDQGRSPGIRTPPGASPLHPYMCLAGKGDRPLSSAPPPRPLRRG